MRPYSVPDLGAIQIIYLLTYLTEPPRPQPAALWPSPRNVPRQRLAIFSNEYYQILIATHLPTPKGWKAELAYVFALPCISRWLSCFIVIRHHQNAWTTEAHSTDLVRLESPHPTVKSHKLPVSTIIMPYLFVARWHSGTVRSRTSDSEVSPSIPIRTAVK